MQKRRSGAGSTEGVMVKLTWSSSCVSTSLMRILKALPRSEPSCSGLLQKSKLPSFMPRSLHAAQATVVLGKLDSMYLARCCVYCEMRTLRMQDTCAPTCHIYSNMCAERTGHAHEHA
jgi:hypothetical protein